jgi:hypothetical protein
VTALPPVDHLVWAGPRLEGEIDRLEALTGVRARPGGRHPAEGTHNALLGLGQGSYLELLAPDPGAPAPGRPRWFGLDTLAGPRLVTWAARAGELEHQAAAARAAGHPLGEIRDGRRELGDGTALAWRLTYPDVRLGDGLVPFLIDWGRSPHPSAAAPEGLVLRELRAEHPDPEAILRLLRPLGIDLAVDRASAPALVATLDTPRGPVELR